MAAALNNDPSEVAIQFDDNIKQLLVVGRRIKYLLVVCGKCSIGIVELGETVQLVRSCCLAFIQPDLVVSRLISGWDNGDAFSVLAQFDQSFHLVQVESIGVFARLGDDVLLNRFLEQKAIHLLSFPHEHIINDLHMISSNSFISVGANPSVGWWSLNNAPAAKSPTLESRASSLTIRAFDRLMPSSLKSPATHESGCQLQLSRKFDEPDRTLNRVLFCTLDFLGCEDYKHGRLLLYDLKEALLVRILKGYRATSAIALDDSIVHLLSLNRHRLESFRLPFDQVASLHTFDENILSGKILNASILVIQSANRLELNQYTQGPQPPLS